MGDTPRSQTISTENHKIVEQGKHKSSSAKSIPGNNDKPPILVGEVSLSNIAILAKQNPEMIFTSLAHRVDLSLLREAFRRIKKSGAAGVYYMH